VPCHRVVSANGSIGGFMGKIKGKTIQQKIMLLEKEGIKINKNKISEEQIISFFSSVS